ncbi:hypothetical protein DNTS_005885 [Danionella cerebrum]|uniref:Uncharacterized protein n=1 Tax=Danionella cerebrum TaxID=2873325 RepID=A0A553R8X0_9TELE|nr:hypothetical protein DNTS_005885 [Danionella translucida]
MTIWLNMIEQELMEDVRLGHAPLQTSVGKEVDQFRRAECASHVPAIKAFFKEVHIFLPAHSLDEITEERISSLAVNTAAVALGQRARQRRTEDRQETVGTNYKRTIAAAEFQRVQRDSFWAQMEREEEQRKKEDQRRATEDRRKREREWAMQEKRESMERERRMYEQEQRIEEQRRIQAQIEAEAFKQKKIKWHQEMERPEEQRCATFILSESEEKAAQEAAALVSQRLFNPREFFRQLSSTSEQTASLPNSPQLARSPFRQLCQSQMDSIFSFVQSPHPPSPYRSSPAFPSTPIIQGPPIFSKTASSLPNETVVSSKSQIKISPRNLDSFTLSAVATKLENPVFSSTELELKSPISEILDTLVFYPPPPSPEHPCPDDSEISDMYLPPPPGFEDSPEASVDNLPGNQKYHVVLPVPPSRPLPLLPGTSQLLKDLETEREFTVRASVISTVDEEDEEVEREMIDVDNGESKLQKESSNDYEIEEISRKEREEKKVKCNSEGNEDGKINEHVQLLKESEIDWSYVKECENKGDEVWENVAIFENEKALKMIEKFERVEILVSNLGEDCMWKNMEGNEEEREKVQGPKVRGTEQESEMIAEFDREEILDPNVIKDCVWKNVEEWEGNEEQRCKTIEEEERERVRGVKERGTGQESEMIGQKEDRIKGWEELGDEDITEEHEEDEKPMETLETNKMLDEFGKENIKQEKVIETYKDQFEQFGNVLVKFKVNEVQVGRVMQEYKSEEDEDPKTMEEPEPEETQKARSTPEDGKIINLLDTLNTMMEDCFRGLIVEASKEVREDQAEIANDAPVFVRGKKEAWKHIETEKSQSFQIMEECEHGKIMMRKCEEEDEGIIVGEEKGGEMGIEGASKKDLEELLIETIGEEPADESESDGKVFQIYEEGAEIVDNQVDMIISAEDAREKEENWMTTNSASEKLEEDAGKGFENQIIDLLQELEPAKEDLPEEKEKQDEKDIFETNRKLTVNIPEQLRYFEPDEEMVKEHECGEIMQTLNDEDGRSSEQVQLEKGKLQSVGELEQVRENICKATESQNNLEENSREMQEPKSQDLNIVEDHKLITLQDGLIENPARQDQNVLMKEKFKSNEKTVMLKNDEVKENSQGCSENLERCSDDPSAQTEEERRGSVEQKTEVRDISKDLAKENNIECKELSLVPEYQSDEREEPVPVSHSLEAAGCCLDGNSGVVHWPGGTDHSSDIEEGEEATSLKPSETEGKQNSGHDPEHQANEDIEYPLMQNYY